jgi:hypothetical protein
MARAIVIQLLGCRTLGSTATGRCVLWPGFERRSRCKPHAACGHSKWAREGAAFEPPFSLASQFGRTPLGSAGISLPPYRCSRLSKRPISSVTILTACSRHRLGNRCPSMASQYRVAVLLVPRSGKNDRQNAKGMLRVARSRTLTALKFSFDRHNLTLGDRAIQKTSLALN